MSLRACRATPPGWNNVVTNHVGDLEDAFAVLLLVGAHAVGWI